MSVVFCVVARGAETLCEAVNPERKGDASREARDCAHHILTKMEGRTVDQAKYTFESLGLHFNLKSAGHITFLCVTNEAFGRRLPFVFLNEITHLFFSKFTQLSMLPEDPDRSQQISLENFASFHPVLEAKCRSYSNSAEFDKLKQIRQGLDDVKEVMVENIDKVLQRAEAIESLVDKSDQLHVSSDSFKRSSKRLKQKTCMADLRTKFLCGTFVVVALYLFLAAICGFQLSCT